MSSSSHITHVKPVQTYQLLHLLGSGSYGKAYLVKSNNDNSLCVLKTISLMNLSPKEKHSTFLEAKILKHLSHPNIITFYEVFLAKKPHPTLNIVTSYADGGDLHKQIALRITFSENQIINWLIQISLAVHYLHSKHIIHRDLKPHNVFLTKKGVVKLGDFGVSKILASSVQKASTCIGTPYYISPEIINEEEYSYKTDIWSLGVCIYQLMALKVPFEGGSVSMLALKIVKGKYEALPKTYSKELRELVGKMLKVNVNERISIKEVLESDVVKQRMNVVMKEIGYGKELKNEKTDEKDSKQSGVMPRIIRRGVQSENNIIKVNSNKHKENENEDNVINKPIITSGDINENVKDSNNINMNIKLKQSHFPNNNNDHIIFNNGLIANYIKQNNSNNFQTSSSPQSSPITQYKSTGHFPNVHPPSPNRYLNLLH